MKELTFEQSHAICGGSGRLWKFIAKNFISKAGDGEYYDEEEDFDFEFDDVYIHDEYPGEGLPPK